MGHGKFKVNNSGVGTLCFELVSPNGTIIAVFKDAERAAAAANAMNAPK